MRLAAERRNWATELFMHRETPGAPPGKFVVDPVAHATEIRVMCYGTEGLVEQSVDSLDVLEELRDRWPVMWVDVVGLGDPKMLNGLAARFDIHPLAIEDVANTHQRPKVEEYENLTFLVIRQMEEGDPPNSEQISFCLGKEFLVTFQEHPGDCWETVRKRIREARGRIRNAGPDYLLYALLDAVVDHYFPVLEDYVERAEKLEDEILEGPGRTQMARIQALKHEFLSIRRDIWPLREMTMVLAREKLPHVTAEMRTYLRDCHDHAMQLVDLLESMRELGSGLMDMYLSNLSHRNNDVMKMLTVIATIFIPLTFIAGIYGMNFDHDVSAFNMPELHWAYGYPFVLGIMLAVALVLLSYFARKGWIGARDKLR